jgi:hypothetical protein
VPVAEVADRLEEALWDSLKHPRGRGGLWIEGFGHGLAHEVEKVGERVEARKPPPRPAISRKTEKPLAQTEAFRRGVRRPEYMTLPGPHGDEFMYDLALDRGFTQRPHKATEEELVKHIKDGDRELWRGVSDESYATALVSGTAHYGQGFRGNGIYAAAGERGRALATGYAQAPPSRGTLVSKTEKPTVIHMALMREAKTIPYAEAASQARDEHLRLSGEKGDRASEVLSLANNSPTRWALAKGYDAVIVPQEDGSDEVVVLNRSALIVSTEFQQAGKNVAAAIRDRPGG